MDRYLVDKVVLRAACKLAKIVAVGNQEEVDVTAMAEDLYDVVTEILVNEEQHRCPSRQD